MLTQRRNGHSFSSGTLLNVSRPVHVKALLNEGNVQPRSNKYRWRREIYGKDYICTMDRKPDPPVEICL